MRFRTKLFLSWGTLVLILWAGSVWPVKYTIQSSFEGMVSENFASARQSLQSLATERLNRMRQACWLLMSIPEVRAAVEDDDYDVPAENLTKLNQRLNELTDVVGVNFICILNAKGRAIAQPQKSPWHSLGELNDFFSQSQQASALRTQLFARTDIAPNPQSARGLNGLWSYHGRLFQVAGVPLRFGSSANASVDGALIMAAPVNDALATELAGGHASGVSFLTREGAVVASSLTAPLRSQLEMEFHRAPWSSAQRRDMRMGNTTYRSSLEPLIDPCSNEPVGAMVVQRSLADAQALQVQVARSLVLIMSSGLLLAALASFVLSGAVTSPVAQLMRGVRRVADGDLEASIDSSRRDELGTLARAFNDMVSQLRTRRELQRMVEESQAANRAKSQFLASMSHEIRTPLNGVIGMTEVLMRKGLNPEQNRCALIVKSSANALLDLINDILDFSKIEAGRLELESTDFDVREIVEEAVEMLAPRATAKGLELACHIPADLQTAVQGDPGRLRQVIVNLIGNALKFTSKGEIIVRAAEETPVQGQRVVRFSVQDSGIGIPKDRLDRLFRAFSQVDASTTRKFGGTGLGLAISKQLVELMGGTIGVESEPGRGSTFWFTVRFSASSSASGARVLPRLRGLRVLAVDDHPAFLEIIKDQLSNWGFDVQTVSDGQRALELLQGAADAGRPFQIAIFDMLMPTMTGPELARLVRSRPRLRGTTMLMLTSLDNPFDTDEMRNAGFAACLTKPVRQSQLFDAIATALAVNDPKQTSSTGILAVPSQPEAQPLRGLRVLLVEDNEVNQLVAREFVEDAGMICECANDGRAALEALRRSTFDLVLMDCQMPEMDGFQATRELRKLEAARQLPGGSGRLPVIALTANAVQGDRERCLDAGMDAYVTKPIDPNELMRTMESFIRREAAAPSSDGTVAASQSAQSHEPVIAIQNASPAGSLETSPIDIAALLQRCRGKASLVEKLLKTFGQQIDAQLDSLRTDLDGRQLQSAGRMAHTIKGMAANLSAGPLCEVASELEKRIVAGEIDVAIGCMDSLNQRAKELVQYLPAANDAVQAKAAASPARVV